MPEVRARTSGAIFGRALIGVVAVTFRTPG